MTGGFFPIGRRDVPRPGRRGNHQTSIGHSTTDAGPTRRYGSLREAPSWGSIRRRGPTMTVVSRSGAR